MDELKRNRNSEATQRFAMAEGGHYPRTGSTRRGGMLPEPKAGAVRWEAGPEGGLPTEYEPHREYEPQEDAVSDGIPIPGGKTEKKYLGLFSPPSLHSPSTAFQWPHQPKVTSRGSQGNVICRRHVLNLELTIPKRNMNVSKNR